MEKFTEKKPIPVQKPSSEQVFAESVNKLMAKWNIMGMMFVETKEALENALNNAMALLNEKNAKIKELEASLAEKSGKSKNKETKVS